MIEQFEVDRIVDKAASAALKGIRLSRVASEPMIDSDGQEALHITVVLKADQKKDVTGDQALNAIVRIKRDLQTSGEERFPVVDFIRENELDMNGDT